MSTLSFVADIRPLFRSYDVESMKPAGIDLSSYEDVKKKGSVHIRPTFRKRYAVRRAVEQPVHAKIQGMDGERDEAVNLK